MSTQGWLDDRISQLPPDIQEGLLRLYVSNRETALALAEMRIELSQHPVWDEWFRTQMTAIVDPVVEEVREMHGRVTQDLEAIRADMRKLHRREMWRVTASWGVVVLALGNLGAFAYWLGM